MYELFDTILVGSDISIGTYLICLLAAGLCGVVTALAAAFRNHASKSFLSSLILLPMIVCTVIAMVNGNVGTGIAVMGAFSLIRFRSVPGKARDIVVIFLAMTAGLACAGGYIAIALLFTVIVSLGMIAVALVPMGNERCMDLHITIPESLRYVNEFDEVFARFTKSHRLLQAKTTNMGSLYKLHYRVEMKDAKQGQAFIDELRCRNGNLEISLAEVMGGMDEL
ncbi:MAG: DUF4956 domain-containing protein [Clostridiales bacterium]|nr:DUF4956 domain-containing protein [Clostridiales bacterium]